MPTPGPSKSKLSVSERLIPWLAQAVHPAIDPVAPPGRNRRHCSPLLLLGRPSLGERRVPAVHPIGRPKDMRRSLPLDDGSLSCGYLPTLPARLACHDRSLPAPLQSCPKQETRSPNISLTDLTSSARQDVLLDRGTLGPPGRHAGCKASSTDGAASRPVRPTDSHADDIRLRSQAHALEAVVRGLPEAGAAVPTDHHGP